MDLLKVSKEGLAGGGDASFIEAGDLDLDFGLRASIILGVGVHQCEIGFTYMSSSSSAVPFLWEGSWLPAITSLGIRDTREVALLSICDEFNGVSSTLWVDKILILSGGVKRSECCCSARWLLG